MDNESIKKHYDEGTLNWHSGFNESIAILGMMESWQGLNVLEIGCGEGHLASMMSYAGADVLGIDYSDNQIQKAQKRYPSVEFRKEIMKFYTEVEGAPFDIAIMQGVLEHLDEPMTDLKSIFDNLADTVILSVPFWNNVRGAVYHTLRILFSAPMSLTDLHYFKHSDFIGFCLRNECKIAEFRLSDKSWGSGPEMVRDLRERIPKAMPDIDRDRVEKLMDYLTDYYNMLDAETNSGANIIYKIRKTS